MIICIGDLHGNFKHLASILEKFKDSVEPITFIQVGDFGFTKQFFKEWKNNKIVLNHPMYVIDGNHEDFDFLSPYAIHVGKPVPIELRPNLFYMSRGTVLEIEGKTIGFMGGGESLDKAYRDKMYWQQGIKMWWKEETVTEEDIRKLWNVKLDMLITHAPPISAITANFPPLIKEEWGLPKDWIDTSAYRIQKLWEHHNFIPLICGHMHKFVKYDTCTMLGINELYEIPVSYL